MLTLSLVYSQTMFAEEVVKGEYLEGVIALTRVATLDLGTSLQLQGGNLGTRLSEHWVLLLVLLRRC